MQNINPNSFSHENSAGPSGFRLERLELWNWGTFNGKAQILQPNGGWALLVGDNGSGKSTAIDALRTLLVPPRILNYNDASGDGRRPGGRDRTRRSYIRGAWASSSTIDSTSPTTQYLRQPGVLSAISAVFSEGSQNQSVTVAQILWEHEDEVRQIFAVSRGSRGLGDLIAGHSNTSDIKRSARRSNWEIQDSFAAYAERMCGLLHIPGDKALEVFNRAIGMKEVSDIDAFVRQFMLPSADTFSFIRDTVQPHYRTLLDCWSAIERAERQITLLRPVAENAERLTASESRMEHWKHLQDIVRPYFATLHLVLLRSQAIELAASSVSAVASRTEIANRLEQHRDERDNINAAINATDVGPRLQVIERELKYAEDSRHRAQQRRERVEPPARLLGTQSALTDALTFISSRHQWEEIEREAITTASESEEKRATKRHFQELALAERRDKLEELQSVERHRVNIPRAFIAVRHALCEKLGIAPEAVPFAGELIEVRVVYAKWTGAIERLLKGFGLSLLIPEQLYRRSAEYINSTPLGLRLTFHRVPEKGPTLPGLSNDRVPGRLEFRTDHPLHHWLINELVRRFNHRCCSSIAELEGTDRGITREGLVRDGTRHIKDDARGIEDLSARILGWTTDNKIAALNKQIAEAERRAQSEAQAAAEAASLAATARDRASSARELLNIADFSDISPSGWSERILSLRSEQSTLEASSEKLLHLQERRREIGSRIRGCETQLQTLDQELGRLNDHVAICRQLTEEREREIRAFPEYDHQKAEAHFSEVLTSLQPLTLHNAQHLIHAATQSLQGKISYEQRKVNEATEKIAAAMSEFLNQFADFRQTLAVGRAYADNFIAVLERIEREDLPRHRERFEHYLNENLVGDLLMLNRRLEEHQESIELRVEEVNSALRTIEYSEDTYVQLHLVNRPGIEVGDFRRSLKSCFEHGVAPAPEERLRIFERVRLLLEQFQRDPQGTQSVTDVRTWFAAGVKELRRVDDSEANFYAATTGKSGGQKAKLAFTILASALAAQYGLSKESRNSPNFRLVVIDEAFSRTDEPNSTRAMQLFANLGFQVLIVGPFDAKARLAIPFVQTVHLASNPSGNDSQLLALTREEMEDAATDNPAQAQQDRPAEAGRPAISGA